MQVFAATLEVHGFPRLRQYSDLARRGSGDGRHPSSLLALRFGAPLLLVFLLVGMLAGKCGPGRLQLDDVRTTYLVGSVALALILFDGGLKTPVCQHPRTVLVPSMVLATAGVLLTALITAPVARYVLDLNWTKSLLVGAVVASTNAAAVFLSVHAPGPAPAAARRRDAGGGSPAPTIRSRSSSL